MKYALVLTIFTLLYSCMPPTEEVVADVEIDITDETAQQLYNLKDERKTDMLIEFLDSANPNYRYIATDAFGSVRDEAALQPLQNLLISDPVEEVRAAAAYAIGQIGASQSTDDLVAAFAYQDTVTMNNTVRMQILEAVGKVGNHKHLKQIATVSTYTSQDDLLLLGQARAIYRFGLRGIVATEGTERMVRLLTDKTVPQETRLMAAHYLQRVRDADITGHQISLANMMSVEPDPQIRMAVASAISRSEDPAVLPTILSQISQDDDYRVQINLLRSLATKPYRSYRDSVVSWINSENPHVAETAAGLIRDHADASDVRPLLSMIQNDEIPSERIKAHLYGAVMKAVPYYFANTRKRASDEAQQAMAEVTTPYEKAAYIDALSYDPINYEVVYQKGMLDDDVYVVTSAILSLENILTAEKFDQIFRTSATKQKVKSDIIGYLMNVYGKDNTGAMAATSTLIRNDALGLKELIDDVTPLENALTKMQLPADLETKMEIEQTIAYLQGQDYEKTALEYSHPIDWAALEGLSDSSRVYILTNRGQIELELYIDDAPGSVANFVKLINDDFYDGIRFHRVVPNFVVQAGCPRGDGYGSLDYTIRSEVGRRYYDDDGYIGMASAGPDTESTQWFITHSPTPHLDGRYTIFGKVVSGMDVVHDIQLGDAIQDIRILKQ